MLRGLIVIVALAAGGLAAWLSLGTPTADPVGTASQSVSESTDVLVAAVDLDRGSVMDPAALRWQAWPVDMINPVYITRAQRPDAMQTLAGLILRNPLIAGEPIFDAKLAGGDAGALSVILAPGKRAVAVRISAENSAGGFVLPNDRVDVLLTTTRLDTTGQNTVISRLILKNVKVLAVDQTSDSTSEAVVGKTATLELSPGEVEIVTAGETSGALSLALRPMSDNAEDSTIPTLPTSEKTTLRIFRGGQMEVVEIN